MERNFAEMLLLNAPNCLTRLDFSRFGLASPLHVNMVRRPVERLVSWYYYNRAAWWAYKDICIPPLIGQDKKKIILSTKFLVVRKKLDGIGAVDNRPTTDLLHQIVQKNKTNFFSFLHVTCDTIPATCDM